MHLWVHSGWQGLTQAGGTPRVELEHRGLDLPALPAVALLLGRQGAATAVALALPQAPHSCSPAGVAAQRSMDERAAASSHHQQGGRSPGGPQGGAQLSGGALRAGGAALEAPSPEKWQHQGGSAGGGDRRLQQLQRPREEPGDAGRPFSTCFGAGAGGSCAAMAGCDPVRAGECGVPRLAAEVAGAVGAVHIHRAPEPCVVAALAADLGAAQGTPSCSDGSWGLLGWAADGAPDHRGGGAGWSLTPPSPDAGTSWKQGPLTWHTASPLPLSLRRILPTVGAGRRSLGPPTCSSSSSSAPSPSTTASSSSSSSSPLLEDPSSSPS